jgi:hypothetical protein
MGRMVPARGCAGAFGSDMKKIRYIYVTYRSPVLRLFRAVLPKVMHLGLVWAGAPRRVVQIPADTGIKTRCTRVIPVRLIECLIFKVKIGRA